MYNLIYNHVLSLECAHLGFPHVLLLMCLLISYVCIAVLCCVVFFVAVHHFVALRSSVLGPVIHVWFLVASHMLSYI
jgi:hypothetical protein